MTLASFGPEAVIYDDGTIARGQDIEVVARDTSTHVSVYSDSLGNVEITNPVQTDTNGNLFFYIASGEYDLLVGSVRIPFSTSGGGGSTPAYTHIQTILNDTWTIIHSLGFKPQVAIEIGGAEVIADVTWPDLNTVIVNLDVPRLGTAHLS